MLETAVLIDLQGNPLYWHTPLGRSSVFLPDSRDLWEVIWEHRHTLAGIAHSHPGGGAPWPSWEDLTTFAAVEDGLGQRLVWWITTRDQLDAFVWRGPHQHHYARIPAQGSAHHNWLEELRQRSHLPPPPGQRIWW